MMNLWIILVFICASSHADVSHLQNYNQGSGLQVITVPGNGVTHKPIYTLPKSKFESSRTDIIRPFQYTPQSADTGRYQHSGQYYNPQPAASEQHFGYNPQPFEVHRQSQRDLSGYQYHPQQNNFAAATNQFPVYTPQPTFTSFNKQQDFYPQPQLAAQRKVFTSTPAINPTFYRPGPSYQQPKQFGQSSYYTNTVGNRFQPVTAASQQVNNVIKDRNQLLSPAKPYRPDFFRQGPFTITTPAPVVRITPANYRQGTTVKTTPAPSLFRFNAPVTFPPRKISDIILASAAATVNPIISPDVYSPPPIVSSTLSTLRVAEDSEDEQVEPILAVTPVTPVRRPSITIYSPSDNSGEPEQHDRQVITHITPKPVTAEPFVRVPLRPYDIPSTTTTRRPYVAPTFTVAPPRQIVTTTPEPIPSTPEVREVTPTPPALFQPAQPVREHFDFFRPLQVNHRAEEPIQYEHPERMYLQPAVEAQRRYEEEEVSGAGYNYPKPAIPFQ